ncbi:MAG TPA: beta-N-acetylhexosaminidase [Gemmatimonas sp.]|uniref:beta-N-acetylhexosaminidase n=1 Tax=Gemmatimonas sp. TaxID=1962908 RepID=UPI002ED8865D
MSALLLSTVLATTSLAAQQAGNVGESRYGLVPRPASLTPRTGQFTLTRTTRLHVAPVFRDVARRFARDVADPLGFEPSIDAGTTAPTGIVLSYRTGIPAEGYHLDVSSSRVLIQASTPAGAFYALETLKQLLPSDIYRKAPIADARWTVPAVRIEDAPRFAWRGAHLDGARHFMPKEFVRKYIDLLARHKLNRFHWHLTDDQGWRLEVKQYPRLTEIASCREATLVGPYVTDPAKRIFDGRRHCGFYTQDDVREIVAYAAERMITVIPEIEMPGHVQAAITAYPHLSSRPDTNPGVMQVWGVSDFVLIPSDSSVAFMQGVLREVLTLFPSPWIHIGGDEADKKQWKDSPAIQARIKSLGLEDEHEMQSWFIRQMDTFLSKQGRRLIGWDEILEGGLAEQATVMSWRGTAGGVAAAKAGHDVVMAPAGYTYFDHLQSRDRSKEPLSIGGFTPLDSAYAFEPVPAELTPEQAKHVLGAQGQLWSEYIPNTKHAEYMAFPRLSALAEVVWTPRERRNFSEFLQRLPAHLKRLDALDVNYRRP